MCLTFIFPLIAAIALPFTLGVSFGLFMLKLEAATLPFVGLGALVSFVFPELATSTALIILAVATACGAVLAAKYDPEAQPEEWVLPAKIGFFVVVVIAAAACQKIYSPDAKLLQLLAVPMYMMAGKVFFRLRYG